MSTCGKKSVQISDDDTRMTFTVDFEQVFAQKGSHYRHKSSHPDVLWKNSVLKKFHKIHSKNMCWSQV